MPKRNESGCNLIATLNQRILHPRQMTAAKEIETAPLSKFEQNEKRPPKSSCLHLQSMTLQKPTNYFYRKIAGEVQYENLSNKF